jgi:hypothetical protein
MGIEVGTGLLISSLIGGGAGIASGLLGKKKTTTVDTSPQLSPELKPLQDDLLKSIQYRLDNGTDLSKVKTPAIEAINRRYRNLPAAITSDYAGRGYGSSGVLQSAIAAGHGDRIGALNGLEGKFAGLQIDQDNQAQEMASRLLASGRGSTQTQTQSGNPVGAGISSGMETLTTLLTLGRMLNGGGAGKTDSSGNSSLNLSSYFKGLGATP